MAQTPGRREQFHFAKSGIKLYQMVSKEIWPDDTLSLPHPHIVCLGYYLHVDL